MNRLKGKIRSKKAKQSLEEMMETVRPYLPKKIVATKVESDRQWKLPEEVIHFECNNTVEVIEQ